MRLVSLTLLGLQALFAEQPQTNNLSAACDQVINDNRGVITITCSGVDKTLMEQLKRTADLLNQIAHRQTDPAVLNGIKDINLKMVEVLRDTRELKTTMVQNNRQISEAQQAIEAAKRYSNVAILPFDGKAMHGAVEIITPLSQMVDKTWYAVAGDKFLPVCEEVALQRDRGAIQQFPDFPFTYYALAYCLERQNNPEWRSYAEKAAAIFEQTTTIGGHDPSHDQCLIFIRELLKSKK